METSLAGADGYHDKVKRSQIEKDFHQFYSKDF